MKKLKLCRDCEITSECETYCRDAIEVEKQDNKGLYMPHKSYKPKGMAFSWEQQKATVRNYE